MSFDIEMVGNKMIAAKKSEIFNNFTANLAWATEKRESRMVKVSSATP